MYLKETYRTPSRSNPSRAKTAYPLGVLSMSGQRHLHTELGRWVNRDPIEEEGGINLYVAMANNLILLVDPLGLTKNPCKKGYNTFDKPYCGDWQKTFSKRWIIDGDPFERRYYDRLYNALLVLGNPALTSFFPERWQVFEISPMKQERKYKQNCMVTCVEVEICEGAEKRRRFGHIYYENYWNEEWRATGNFKEKKRFLYYEWTSGLVGSGSPPIDA